jgi:signal transduction histidine kinase
MFFVRVPKLARSAGFRFALLNTVVFVISVSFIAWVAETALTAALQRQARDRVETEVASLLAAYQHEGITGLRAAIRERSSGKGRLHYAIIDPQKPTIFGDRYLAEFSGTKTTEAQLLARQDSDNATDNILVENRPLKGGLRLIVADNLESVEDLQNVISNSFLVTAALAVILGVGAGIFLSRSILHRVENVTKTAEGIIGGDLSQRIALSGSGDDFDRLSATLNTMLDRITGLLESLRQVSSDIAHDLRTPLSHLRQRLESVRTREASIEEYKQAIDDAIEEADALLGTFSALLRIAQIEAGMRRSSFRSVDLSDVMRTVADAYRPVLEDGRHFLQTDISKEVKITGDRELLFQLFVNLIENALRHTPPGCHIKMRLRDSPTGVLAEVSDDGPGVPLQERERVFQRFYRLEHSRTTPGNGLGLSLVAAIAELHHATIDLLDNKPGLIVLIRFPKTTPGLPRARPQPKRIDDGPKDNSTKI